MTPTIASSIFMFLCVCVGLGMYGCPQYSVYEQRLSGEAELAKAEYSRKVQVADALGRYEAAKSLASAEVERAKGVAQANAIIGDSLKNNEAYLRWLYIEGLREKTGEVIYVPTEAGLPILEAGKRVNKQTKE
jgi:regulator of protease activity HflC (stomatin/prohibitin superfamily)